MIEVKNIIFDLGGVLLPIDYQATPNAFKNLGISDFDALYSQHQQSSLFDDYETGRISEKSFFEGLCGILGEYPHDVMMECWNAMLGKLHPAVPDFLFKCKNHYRIFLLSNTNYTHIKAFRQGLMTINPTHFFGLFDQYYLSFEVGLRKPDQEIFDYVIEHAGLNRNETLFIEDTRRNVDGAVAAGIPTIFLDIPSGMNTLDLFDREGKLKERSFEIIQQ